MSDEKKLHIDEDWKTQVEREKEQLRNKQSATLVSDEAAVGQDADSGREVAEDVSRQSAPSGDLPPASLVILVSSLASQAMASMGQLPDENGKPMAMNLPLARHFIDLLGVIEDKTRNNLTSDEAAFLSSTLHHLRMAFVEISRR